MDGREEKAIFEPVGKRIGNEEIRGRAQMTDDRWQ
jgi:hypothetical protein